MMTCILSTMREFNNRKKSTNKNYKRPLQNLIIKESNKKSSMSKREDSLRKLNHSSRSKCLKSKRKEP